MGARVCGGQRITCGQVLTFHEGSRDLIWVSGLAASAPIAKPSHKPSNFQNIFYPPCVFAYALM